MFALRSCPTSRLYLVHDTFEYSDSNEDYDSFGRKERVGGGDRG